MSRRLPAINPLDHVRGQLAPATRDNDNVGRGGILDGNLPKFWQQQHVELPHLVGEGTVRSQSLGQKVVSSFGELAGVKILISDYHLERRIGIHAGWA